ncbi:MAG: hypothetical protein J1F11_00520 [Oscillospiraceae bacterium]|nr:hypothetical protein [Oscillospiraceae bacterium]
MKLKKLFAAAAAALMLSAVVLTANADIFENDEGLTAAYSDDGISPVADGEGIPIDDEHFPDWFFQTVIKGSSIDINGDGYLSQDEIDAVCNPDPIKPLFLDNNHIEDLTGIEYFTDLKLLSCSNNQITNLDISKLTNLIYLNCNKNQLTSLDLSNNTNFTTLFCNENQLTSLDLSGCTQLTSKNFSAKDNKCVIALNELTVDALCEELKKYNKNFDKNNITSWDSGVEGNYITGDTVSYTYYCGIEGCYLEAEIEIAISIDETFDDELAKIIGDCLKDGDGNSLNGLADDGKFSSEEISQVKQISISNAEKVESLEGIKIFYNLKNLLCNESRITELDLSGLENLEEVTVKYSYSPNQPKEERGALKIINVTGCQSLTAIWANGNSINEIIGLDDCKNLITLDMEYTDITSIDLSKLENLSDVRLHYTPLISIDISKNAITDKEKFGVGWHLSSMGEVTDGSSLIAKMRAYDGNFRVEKTSNWQYATKLNTDKTTSTTNGDDWTDWKEMNALLGDNAENAGGLIRTLALQNYTAGDIEIPEGLAIPEGAILVKYNYDYGVTYADDPYHTKFIPEIMITIAKPPEVGTKPTDPEPTEPEPTDPEPTEPEPTDPDPTDPKPTDPEPTDPKPTDPEPSEPERPGQDNENNKPAPEAPVPPGNGYYPAPGIYIPAGVSSSEGEDVSSDAGIYESGELIDSVTHVWIAIIPFVTAVIGSIIKKRLRSNK